MGKFKTKLLQDSNRSSIPRKASCANRSQSKFAKRMRENQATRFGGISTTPKRLANEKPELSGIGNGAIATAKLTDPDHTVIGQYGEC